MVLLIGYDTRILSIASQAQKPIEQMDMLSTFQIGNKMIEICLQVRNAKLFLRLCFSLSFLAFRLSSHNIWLSACMRRICSHFKQRKNWMKSTLKTKSDKAIEVRVWMAKKNGLYFNDGIRQLFNRVSMNNYPMRVCFVLFFYIFSFFLPYEQNVIIIVWVFLVSCAQPYPAPVCFVAFPFCVFYKTVCIGKTNDNDEADATTIWLIWILI